MTTTEKIEGSKGYELERFRQWWQDDVERAKCTLPQIVGAYCSSFPGRIFKLLVELIAEKNI
jgi:hypothetical protein